MIAILYDATRCVGCNKCVQACTAENRLDPEIPDPTTEPDGLSGRRWTSIVLIPGQKRYVKKQCLHCLKPGCQSACLVGAMTKTPEGPVLYDQTKCIGCRYCMLACPVGIPRFEWNKTLPYVQKCDLCSDRILQGKKCACVEACPHGALFQGDREEMLARAYQMIAQNPGQYLNHVYGERELGGTSVLYISDVPLEQVLRFPESVGSAALPDLTWPVINKTPVVALSALGALIGVYWIIERRMKLAAEGEKNHSGDRTQSEPGPKR